MGESELQVEVMRLREQIDKFRAIARILFAGHSERNAAEAQARAQSGAYYRVKARLDSRKEGIERRKSD